MDADMLLRKYPNVSREEVDKIRETLHYSSFNQFRFEDWVSFLHERREEEKLNGRDSALAGPLLQLVWTRLLCADNVDQKASFSVYGRIHAEFRDSTSGEVMVHYFYNRESVDAQVLESNDCLSLINPDYSCLPFDISMPLDHTKLVVDLYVGEKKLSGEFQCEATDEESVTVESLHCDFGTLLLCYNLIPFAVRGRVGVRFFRKQGCTQADSSLKVNGTIVARSSDKLRGYSLFDKKSDDFEHVDFDVASLGATMSLSRCWIGISAHSPLILDVDLFEYGTGRQILKESIELQFQMNWRSCDRFIVEDVRVDVFVDWFSPMPHGRCLDDESSDDETSSSDEECDDEQMIEACIPIVPSDFSRTRQLQAHKDIPLSSCGLQIYSIFIGREDVRALQIYGSIKVAAPPHSYYIFNREVRGAYDLAEHRKTMPIENGCGVYSDCETLKIKFDLKDLNSDLRIRGNVTWHWSSFDVSPGGIDTQLCSVVQGEYGFAAIHYSLFSDAVQAKIQVWCREKNERVDIFPKVFGSLVAHYNNYDYAPRYNRDYYRICLFERNQEDPAEVGTGGVISLARRDVVVVPLGSSLMVEANLFDAVSNEFFSGTLEFRVGCLDPVVLEGEDYCIYVHVKWEDLGN